MCKRRASNHNTSASSFSVTKAATQNPITHKTQEKEQIQPIEEECGGVGRRRRRRRAKETRKEKRWVRRQTMVRGRAGRKKGCNEGRGAKQQQPAATEVAARAKKQESGGGEQPREREGTSWEQDNER
jgi:hypothetical protein